MPLLIKICVPRQFETLELDHVRPGFTFRWEEKHHAYVYRPKTQAEIDSIFDAQRMYRSVWTFIPLLEEGAAEPVKRDPKELAQATALQAELDRVNGLLTAATKRIANLNTELADVRANAAKLKAEAEKAIAAASAVLKPEAEAKRGPGRQKRETSPAPAAPISPDSVDDAPPAD
jgi:hypothetical protein